MDEWGGSVAEAVELQRRLRDRVISKPPPRFKPRLIAGADVSINRFGDRVWAGGVVLDAASAHPRRFGIASHGGVLFDVPSIGCAKSILVGKPEPLGPERGATAELVDKGEVVGEAVRLRDRVAPVYVSRGHRMDLPTAVRIVQSASGGYRLPETTRRAHALVNELRSQGH